MTAPEVIATTLYQCEVGRASYPRTNVYFSKNEDTYEYTNLCKSCEGAKKRQEDNLEVEERMRKLDMGAMALMDAMVERPDRRSLVHMAEMWQCAGQVFGGPEVIMKRYMATYMMSDPGSTNRKNILDSLVKIGQHESVAAAAQIPLEMLTDDDLEELHREQLKRITLHEPEFNVKDSTADEDAA